MGYVVNSHLLAASIISRHNTPDDILDTTELSLLREFCINPSQADAILRSHDMIDGPGDELGSKAQQKGSLVAYVIARHETERPALSEEEVAMLKDWFEKGGAGEGSVS